MKESSMFNFIFTSLKLCILCFIVTVSFIYFDISNYSPFFPEPTDKGGPFRGIIEGATLVYYGYVGFDLMTIIAEESKNPAKDVPRAVVSSILYVCVVYMLISFSV
jgi:APA family basic amino acid/polyamine antiporter